MTDPNLPKITAPDHPETSRHFEAISILHRKLRYINRKLSVCTDETLKYIFLKDAKAIRYSIAALDSMPKAITRKQRVDYWTSREVKDIEYEKENAE